MAVSVGKSAEDTDFETAGHTAVCRELIELMKPNNKRFIWYRPDILAEDAQCLHLDFLLYAPLLGLPVIEVRDWAVLALKKVLAVRRSDLKMTALSG